MRTKSRLIRLLLIGAMLTGAVAVSSGQADPVHAQTSSPQWCQCVKYVMNVYRLRQLDGYYPTAASLDQPNSRGVWMERQGFRRTYPSTGSVVVMQAYVGGARGEGHIGRVTGVWYENSGRTLAFGLRSSNWAGSWFTHAGCYNVTQATVRVSSTRGLSFWRK